MSFHRFYRISTSLFSKIFGRTLNLKKYFEYVKKNLPIGISLKINLKEIFIIALLNSKKSSLSTSTEQVLTAETENRFTENATEEKRIKDFMRKNAFDFFGM